jgi:hypothetical protein
MNMNHFASLRVSSVALLVAACGGGDGFTSGNQNLGEDSGAGGSELGAGGDNAGGSGQVASGGNAGGANPGSGGSTGGASSSGGAVTGTAGVTHGSGGNPAGDDAGLGGSGGVASDGGVAGGAGVPGSGGAFDAGGAGNDAGPTIVVPPPAGIVAYGYAGDATSTTAYELSAAYRFHDNGGTVTSRLTASVGTYQIVLNGLNAPVQNVQATAYDQAAYCTVAAFGVDKATVRCYDFTGAANGNKLLGGDAKYVYLLNSGCCTSTLDKVLK